MVLRSRSDMRVCLRKGLLVFLLFSVAFSARAVCYGDQRQAMRPIVFSPVPQLPAPTLFARWMPLLEVLGQETGQCFELVINQTIPDFERLLFRGEIGLAYANPYHAVLAYKSRGYLPLLADAALLTGILVVRRDSEIRQLSDLRGRRVDFPAPNAFAASLLLRAHLQSLHIEIQPRYVKTHGNVYRSVILGEALAGGGVNKTLLSEPEEMRQHLKVLYETPGYRSHPLIANPKIPLPLRARIQERFINLAKTESGRALLAGVQISDPIPVNYANDYRPLEKLRLQKLVVLDE